MSSIRTAVATPCHAKDVEAARQVRSDVELDVIRGRRVDAGCKFLPDGLSRIGDLPFLSAHQARFLSQVQGRTYANMLELVERSIGGARAIELAEGRRPGDRNAHEAPLRPADEEPKHQALFRRLDAMAADRMPRGYRFVPDARGIAAAVLAGSNWARMALRLEMEISALAHYRSSLDPATELCPLWKDVFLFRWKEESQHAILDEMAWRRAHAHLTEAERDRGVNELIELVGVVDGHLQAQAAADADYFLAAVGRAFCRDEATAVHDRLLAAYRWQHLVSGTQEPRFGEVLKALTTPAQRQRIRHELAPIVEHAAR